METSRCKIAWCGLSTLSTPIIFGIMIWSAINGCDVKNPAMGCASGKVYRVASEMQRKADSMNTSMTVRYCGTNIYKCDSSTSYGLQCGDATQVIDCTWAFGGEPPFTTPDVKHIVIAQYPSAKNDFNANVCVVDDASQFASMKYMQSVFIASIVVFSVMILLVVPISWWCIIDPNCS